MRKMTKRVLFVFVIACMIFGIAAAGVPSKPSNFEYWYDYDGSVLTSSQKAEISEYGEALKNATGDQVVAVIVTFLDGMDIDDYKTDLINQWGIGDSSSNNGAVVLLSTGDREIAIGTGKGLDRIMTGGTSGNLIDNNFDYFADGKYGAGMVALYRDVCNYLADARGKTLQLASSSSSAGSRNNAVSSRSSSGSGEESGLFEGIIGLIVAYIVISAIVNTLFRGRSGGCLNWLFMGWLFNNNRRGPRGGYGGGFGPRPPRNGGFGNPGPRPPRSGGFGSGTRSSGGSRSFGGGSSRGGFGGGSRGSFGGGSSRGGGASRKF